MPQEHLYYKEVNSHDGAYYRRWASVYGDSMVTLIDRILHSAKHEEQAYHSCAGVLHSCKDVPHRLIREAADKCVEANACKYSYFKKVLGMVQNNHAVDMGTSSTNLPFHSNTLETQLKDPNANLNTFIERISAMVDAEWQSRG